MKKKAATTNRFEVYDFDESDDVVQHSAQKIVNKFNNLTFNKPKKPKFSSPVTKYSFLQCFAQGTESKPKELFNSKIEVEDEGDTIKEGLSYCNEIASSGSSNCSPATCTENELVTINIDDDDDDDDIASSASTSSSKFAGNEGALEEKRLEHRFSGCTIDGDVVVWPNYMLYGDIYSANCQITFSSSSIKVECSAVCGNKRSFDIEWTLDDIKKIESQWCDQFKTAAVKFLLDLGDQKMAKDGEMSRGIAELRFAVYDSCWHKQQEAIKLLNTRYESKWVIVSDIDARSQEGCLEKNNFFISKNYFPNLDLEESVKEFVYPRGDPDAVSVNMKDIELLLPETFVNDTIIDFYIKYLESKINPEEKHRFHFFNCFFFRKLADLDKDPCGAGDGRAAFQRVRKWTRRVSLFEKDYIFIPVNFSLHWSLVVICHPGEAANFEDEDLQKLPKVPCILHMDSIKGSHRGLKNLFQSYLWEEWKERGNQPEDVSSKFLNLQFLPLELPQQENSFDCGIFLLHYVELFLEHAPVSFNPFREKKISKFLNKDWFPPVEASLKRAHIKDVINRIAEEYVENVPPASRDRDTHFSSEVLVVEERGIDAELLDETCRLPKAESCLTNYQSSFSDQESEIEPLGGTPYRGGIACGKEHDFCERSFFDDNCRSFEQLILRDRVKSIMTPIEEVEETLEQHAKLESSSSSEMEVSENHLFHDLFGSNSSETNDILRSPSTESAERATYIVEDSEEEDGVIEVTDHERSLFGLRKVKGTSKVEGDSFDCIIVQTVDSDPIIELDKKMGSKRRSPRPLERVRRRLRSSSKELHELHMCE